MFSPNIGIKTSDPEKEEVCLSEVPATPGVYQYYQPQFPRKRAHSTALNYCACHDSHGTNPFIPESQGSTALMTLKLRQF